MVGKPSKVLPVSNRNTRIMGNFVCKKIGEHALKGIFKDLPYPAQEAGVFFNSPEEFFMWEFGWHSLDTYNQAYLRLRDLFGPSVYEECGSMVGKFVDLGTMKNMKYALGGVEGALLRVPEINKIFNDTKDFFILDGPKRDRNEVEITYLIRFHDDIDPHSDWKSDPHIRGILSQISCVWGLPPGKVRQPIVPYSLERLCEKEFEFSRLDLDPNIVKDKMVIRDPLTGKKRIYAERVVLDPSKISAEKVDKLRTMFEGEIFDGSWHRFKKGLKGDYTGFRTLKDLEIPHIDLKSEDGRSKTVLIPAGTILAEELYFVTEYRSFAASKNPVERFMRATYYKYFERIKDEGKDWVETHMALVQENKSKEEALREQARLIKENKDLIENLEMRVEERTKELKEANNRLERTLIELKEAQSRIIEKGKTEALGDLTAGVAHEINNPAAGILTTSELLIEMESSKGTQLRSLIERIDRDQLMRMLRLADDIYKKSILNRLSTKELRAKTQKLKNIAIKLHPDIKHDKVKELARMQLDPPDMEMLFTTFPEDCHDKILNYLSLTLSIGSMLYTIKTGSKRIVELTSALKGHVRLDEAEEGPVDIEKGIEDTILVLSNKLKNVNVVRDFNYIPIISGYPRDLNQVWLNLLSNARDAITDQGTIRIGIYDKESQILVTVEDNGIGIPDEIKDKIFDPFFTTKGRAYGTGLGLKICRDKIEKHNGMITVRSKPGDTVFEVTLPKKK